MPNVLVCPQVISVTSSKYTLCRLYSLMGLLGPVVKEDYKSEAKGSPTIHQGVEEFKLPLFIIILKKL